MRTALVAIATSLLVLVAATGTARAIDRHERVVIKPIKKGKEIVGIRLEMTLRPERYTHARVGIAPAKKYQQGKSNKTFRHAASDPKVGHLLHQFKEVRVQKYVPKQVSFDVLYKDQPNLKPGGRIEVVTAFSETGRLSDYWHVYGMASLLMERPQRYALPGSEASPQTATAANKPAAAKPTTAKKPAAARPTAASIRASTRAAQSSATTTRRRTHPKPTTARAKPTAARARTR